MHRGGKMKPMAAYSFVQHVACDSQMRDLIALTTLELFHSVRFERRNRFALFCWNSPQACKLLINLMWLNWTKSDIYKSSNTRFVLGALHHCVAIVSFLHCIQQWSCSLFLQSNSNRPSVHPHEAPRVSNAPWEAFYRCSHFENFTVGKSFSEAL